LRSKKVRFVPSHDQQRKLNILFNDSRSVYNECIALYRKKEKNIRDKVLRSKLMREGLKFTLRSSEHIRQKAYDKFSSSKNSCEERNGHLKFKSRKNYSQVIGIQHRDICFTSKNEFSFMKETFKMCENIGNVGFFSQDAEILKERGRYYIIIVEARNVPCKSEVKRVVSLDMGERKFGSFYSPNGEIGFIAEECGEIIKNKILRKDKLYKRIEVENDNLKKKRMYKAWCRLSKRITSFVDDLHFKTINYLVQNYDTIIIGRLTNGVLKGKRPKIQKQLHSALKHYQFRQRLINACTIYGKQCFVVYEGLTTKTCSRCGFVNWKMKAEEIFKCPKCHYTCDRDIASSRNIFCKNTR
jgi:transposase